MSRYVYVTEVQHGDGRWVWYGMDMTLTTARATAKELKHDRWRRVRYTRDKVVAEKGARR